MQTLQTRRWANACGVEWAEIDVDKAIGLIPAWKMEMRRPHGVSLSRQGPAMIAELRAIPARHFTAYACLMLSDGSFAMIWNYNSSNAVSRRRNRAGALAAMLSCTPCAESLGISDSALSGACLVRSRMSVNALFSRPAALPNCTKCRPTTSAMRWRRCLPTAIAGINLATVSSSPQAWAWNARPVIRSQAGITENRAKVALRSAAE